MALKYLYVPSGYKASKTYGVLPNEAVADLAFVRGSSATRINANGLVETMGTNVPRLDYTDGSCPTLLTEPSSVNLLFNSGWEGTTSLPTDWTYGHQTGTSTQVTSIKNASVKAYRFQGTSQRQYFTRAFTTVIGTTYTLSVYVQSTTGSLRIQDILYRVNGGGTDVFKKDGIVVSGTDIAVADSFYSVTFTADVAITNALYRAGLGVINDATGDVTLSMPQLEELEYRTSFILSPTGSTETRSADTGVISGDLSSYINSSEGVLEIKAKALFNGGEDVRISLSDGTSDNRLGLIWFTSANNTSVVLRAGGSDVLTQNLNIDQTLMTTFKIKWKSGDIQVKVNGTLVLTDTSSFSGLTLDQLSFDKGTETNQFEGNVQYIKVYDSITDF